MRFLLSRPPVAGWGWLSCRGKLVTNVTVHFVTIKADTVSKTSEIEFDLETFIPYRLNRISEQISLDFSKFYKGEYGMTRPEWRVLANLGQHGVLTAKQICHLSGQHKTKVSRAVAGLAKRDWLKRMPNHEDRREEWLQLTSSGKTAYRRIAVKGIEHDAGLMSALGNNGSEALLLALHTLEAKLQLTDSRRKKR